jgi:hypothetical protein
VPNDDTGFRLQGKDHPYAPVRRRDDPRPEWRDASGFGARQFNRAPVFAEGLP